MDGERNSQLHPDSGIAANHHSPANQGGVHLELDMKTVTPTKQGQNVCKMHGSHLYSRCKCGHLYCMKYWSYCPRCGTANATNREGGRP